MSKTASPFIIPFWEYMYVYCNKYLKEYLDDHLIDSHGLKHMVNPKPVSHVHLSESSHEIIKAIWRDVVCGC